MLNDLMLLWNGFLAFPTSLHIVFTGLIAIWFLLMYIAYSQARSPTNSWYNINIKHINAAFAKVRREFKSEEARRLAYISTYRELSDKLNYEIGTDYTDYTTTQRSVMIYLLTRYRDVMYFYTPKKK